MSLQLTVETRARTATYDSYICSLKNSPNVTVQIWWRGVEPTKDFPDSSDWQLIREGTLNNEGLYTTDIGFPKPQYSGWKMQLAGVDENEVHSNVVTVEVEGVITPTPEEPEEPAPPTKEGCFIATACYGSSTHSKVIELRKIKNRLVAQSKIASYLYKIYYVFSPAVAQKIRDMPRIKAVIRKTIDLLT